MFDSDKKQFLLMLVAMSEYYDKPMSEGVLELWWIDLREFDLRAVEKAFHQHRRSDTGQFFPKSSDIIKLIGGSTEDRALRTWATVEKAIRQVGVYQSVTFDDPITMRVLLDMGGWEKMCGGKEAELPFVMKEFVTRYRGFAAQGDAPEFPSHLPGMSERLNLMSGRKTDAPLLIGNQAKAREVLESGKKTALLTVKRFSDVTTNLLTRKDES